MKLLNFGLHPTADLSYKISLFDFQAILGQVGSRSLVLKGEDGFQGVRFFRRVSYIEEYSGDSQFWCPKFSSGVGEPHGSLTACLTKGWQSTTTQICGKLWKHYIYTGMRNCKSSVQGTPLFDLFLSESCWSREPSWLSLASRTFDVYRCHLLW